MPLPSDHAAFLAWSHEAGITSTSITPSVIPSAGIGILTTSALSGPTASRVEDGYRHGLKAGETICSVPNSALLHRESADKFSPGLSRFVREGKGGWSTHAVLATACARERRNERHAWRPWIEVWPSMEELKTTMPVLWAEKEKNLLPPSAKKLLEQQEANLARDWKIVSPSSSQLGIKHEDFVWGWLVVNTRTLFYKPDTAAYSERSRADCMCLCPFIDYFNHNDEPSVTVSPSAPLSRPGFIVSTTTALPPKSQIFVSYGCHSTDFLLIEYGFLLPSNRWDEVSIDALLLPRLSSKQKALLEEEGFLGNYSFDRNGFCFRSQAAVRMCLVPTGTQFETYGVGLWRRFLGGEEETEGTGDFQKQVDKILREICCELKKKGEGVRKVVKEKGVEEGKRTLVRRRWMQVLEMVESVERGLEG